MDRIQKFLSLATSGTSLSNEDKVELQLLLNDLRQMYDEGNPIISDSDYDTLNELAIYEGEVRSSSEDASYGERVKHPIDIMRGTLDKIYYLSDDDPRTNKSRKSLSEWMRDKQEILSRYGINILDEQVIVTPKYDGMSCCLYVDKNGHGLWLTRGDTGTNEGVDIGHIMKFMNYPMQPNTVTQFELLIEDDMLDELNERYSTAYKNTRALTAGIIRTKETDYRAQYIRPIPLKLYKNGQLVIHPDQLSQYASLKCTLRDISRIKEFANANRHVLGKFRTDGAVITLINPKVQQILGRKDNINQFEVAYKFTEEKAYSIVQDIHFQVSEFGIVTPVLEITPIVMKGNSISRISLHNKVRFDELNLKYFDTVQVLYDIIPYCTLDDFCRKKNQLNNHNAILFPDTCPECGKKLDLTQAIACCTNPNCPSVRIGRVINYLDCLDCKGIGPETVRRLADLGVITDIPSLYKIGHSKQIRIIMDSHGFGELKVKMILGEIRKITTLVDYDFYGALGFRGLNKLFFKLIFEKIDSEIFTTKVVAKNYDGIFEDVLSLKGVAEKKAELLIQSLKKYREEILRLLKVVNIQKSYGMTSSTRGVVFTGFRDSDLAKSLEKLGYFYQDGINAKTVLVVKKDENFTSSTTQKAEAKKIKIVTVDDVKRGL